MRPLPTIFALSSGAGRAGVAVIRISGAATRGIVEAMAAPCPPARRAAFRRIRHPSSAEILDEALVLWFPAPSSETGEDMAEFQVHGSPAVIRAVLNALATLPGCRLAEPGEFARRGFENGKLDLSAIEGLADLIDAETEAQRRQAMSHLGGSFARLCDGWSGQILEARGLAEAAIDFSDEPDVSTDAMASARAVIAPVREALAQYLADPHRGELVREGFRIVLAGRPNAGKSSLLNALARRDVAIVSPEAGTTRDILEVRLDLGGYAVHISDTAGLHEATGIVEREGIRRAVERARAADLVLWLVDATDPDWHPPSRLGVDPDQILTILNKIDLRDADKAQFNDPAAADGRVSRTLAISALTGNGLETVIARLTALVAGRLGASASVVLPTQVRHLRAIEECHAALMRFEGLRASDAEFAAEDLRLAADALGRITGRTDPEAVLGLIFGRFCIGK